MAYVIVSDLNQFIEELRQECLFVERRVVRVAQLEDRFWSSGIRRGHLIVTTRIGKDIVRLDQIYSPLSDDDREHDNGLSGAMISHLAQLQDTCRKLGLQILRGILEEGM